MRNVEEAKRAMTTFASYRYSFDPLQSCFGPKAFTLLSNSEQLQSCFGPKAFTLLSNSEQLQSCFGPKSFTLLPNSEKNPPVG